MKTIKSKRKTPANYLAKTASRSHSSKPKLKLVTPIDIRAQVDILEQLHALVKEAKNGVIENLVIYRELKTGEYFLHTTPCEDIQKTAMNLFQMWFIRMGLHR